MYIHGVIMETVSLATVLQQIYAIPEKVTAFAENQVSHIYALGSGSAAMTSDGHVYTWGSAAKSNTIPALVNKGEADSNEDVIDNVWYLSTGFESLNSIQSKQ